MGDEEGVGGPTLHVDIDGIDSVAEPASGVPQPAPTRVAYPREPCWRCRPDATRPAGSARRRSGDRAVQMPICQRAGEMDLVGS